MTGSTRGLKGLWHVALKVTDLKRTQAFYEGLFGMLRKRRFDYLSRCVTEIFGESGVYTVAIAAAQSQ